MCVVFILFVGIHSDWVMCSFKYCVVIWCVRVYSFNNVVICVYIRIVLVSCVGWMGGVMSDVSGVGGLSEIAEFLLVG